MKLYFSGVASPTERDMLIAAGVRDYLVDPVDYKNLPTVRESFAIDSGAYRAWKCGVELDIPTWLQFCGNVNEEPDFFIMPDVLGDWQATWKRWRIVCEEGINCVPVWQWGAPVSDLDDLFCGNDLVCLGGLVPAMRANDDKVLVEVKAICRDYGSKLHFLGLNWLKAMHELMPLLKSADTSKWLDGARYGQVFAMMPDGCLGQMHKIAAGMPDADRQTLCIQCATTMREWVEGTLAPKPEREVARVYQLTEPKVFQANRRQKALTSWESFRFETENEKRHQKAKERLAAEGYGRR